MASSGTVSFAITVACLAAVFLLSVPFIQQCIARFKSKRNYSESFETVYEDRDGIATEESQAAFSDVIPRLILISGSVVGSLDALVSAVLSSNYSDSSIVIAQWFQLITWLLLIFQSTTLFITSSSTQRYCLGIYGSGSCFLLAIAIAVENISIKQSGIAPLPRNAHLTLSIIQFTTAVILAIINLLIPRRPDVFRNDKVVDRQHTVSVLNKFTFSWPAPVLTFALKNKGLEYNDLPEIGYQVRSKTLQESFDAVGKKSKLWKTIFFSHMSAFIQQWTLQTICSVAEFSPQIALYFILKTLEARDNGEMVQLQSWLWVLGLGAASTAASWIESWLFFVVFMRLGVPIYEQLAAVVFRKAIRRKDVKGAGQKLDEKPDANGEILVNKDSGVKGESTLPGKDEDDDDEDIQKSRQSTINLVGVDSKRIADFATYNYIILGSAVKLIFALGFLSRLIGWLPLLGGFAIPIIILPLNMFAARRYANAQDSLMKYRDQKMAVVTEALQGIRQIKFSALERNWYEKILQTRRKELNTQWKVFIYDTTLISIWIFGPVMLAAISLAIYTIINQQLTASVAFTTISIFEVIEMTLAIIPEMVTDLLDSMVSAERVQKYLESPEREDSISEGETVSFRDATIAWPSDDPEQEERFQLRNLNLSFPKNELGVVSGKTGSGKSLLLSSVIGESDVVKGVVAAPRAPSVADRHDLKATKADWIIDSATAFVAQIPWIENATIRDNILFGLPMDQERYSKVLYACALEKDLEMLTDGELTDIGANGINLSGGQKWRVSFARALYSRAGILILDDIFSAVDANVGKHLFEEALTGELGRGRTRILVTHHVALCLPKTKYSVLLADGKVKKAGLTEDLRKDGSLRLILAQDISEKKDDEEVLHQEISNIDDGGGLQKLLSNQSLKTRRQSVLSDAGADLNRRQSRAGADDAKPAASPKKFTEEEKRETGAIKSKIYLEYIKASGGFKYWTVIMFLFILWIGVYLARSYWISIWTRSYRTESVPSNRFIQQTSAYFQQLRSEIVTADVDPNLWYYLGVYLAISLCAWIVGTVRYFSVFISSIRASKDLFEKLTFSVLRAPLRWLDTVPLGRILNRFTADFNMLDSRISMDLAFMLHNAMQVLSVIIAGLSVSPFMIFPAVALMLVSWHFARRYLAGAREVKRLESNAKSPVFEQFGSVLMGIGTIRAFDRANAYVDRMYDKIDTHCRAYWHLWLFNRWMGFRLNMVGAIFAAITAALIVSIPGIDAPLAGFALSFAIGLAESVIWLLRQYANVELDMNATERIIEYSNITIENHEGQDAPAAWPTEGKLEVSDLVVGYAADLPPVLKGLTFSISKNQRIGVVGRTGAGKSSLTLALFRFLEARSGSIHIDGVDISRIKLYDLRSRLAIIPQDPVLFSGTVRTNLDAFDEHEDRELRDALARVHLASFSMEGSTAPSGSATPNLGQNAPDTNKNIFRSLSSKISEGGLNLSQGQRQLLCLARAIVSRPKIMVLDEATSAVDMETDALIQRSIREEFQDSTLIVIAHRLSTIADFDKILVMGDGRVLEYDSPKKLMETENGHFRKMVEESGERAELEAVISGSTS